MAAPPEQQEWAVTAALDASAVYNIARFEGDRRCANTACKRHDRTVQGTVCDTCKVPVRPLPDVVKCTPPLLMSLEVPDVDDPDEDIAVAGADNPTRQRRRRKKREDVPQWVFRDSGDTVFQGSSEEQTSAAAYVAFQPVCRHEPACAALSECPAPAFEVVPVREWHRFRQPPRHRTLTLDEAEAIEAQRARGVERWVMQRGGALQGRLAPGLEEDAEDAAARKRQEKRRFVDDGEPAAARGSGSGSSSRPPTLDAAVDDEDDAAGSDADMDAESEGEMAEDTAWLGGGSDGELSDEDEDGAGGGATAAGAALDENGREMKALLRQQEVAAQEAASAAPAPGEEAAAAAAAAEETGTAGGEGVEESKGEPPAKRARKSASRMTEEHVRQVFAREGGKLKLRDLKSKFKKELKHANPKVAQKNQEMLRTILRKLAQQKDDPFLGSVLQLKPQFLHAAVE